MYSFQVNAAIQKTRQAAAVIVAKCTHTRHTTHPPHTHKEADTGMYTYTDGIQRQTHEPADRHTEVNMEAFDLKAIFVQNPHEVSLLPRAVL